jgi:hypothetical protein
MLGNEDQQSAVTKVPDSMPNEHVQHSAVKAGALLLARAKHQAAWSPTHAAAQASRSNMEN